MLLYVCNECVFTISLFIPLNNVIIHMTAFSYGGFENEETIADLWGQQWSTMTPLTQFDLKPSINSVLRGVWSQIKNRLSPAGGKWHQSSHGLD